MRQLRIPLPPVEYLRECFAYDAGTGELRWNDRPLCHFPDRRTWKMFNSRYAGTLAGTKTDSHFGVRVGGVKFFLHRIIFKLQTGQEPPLELDHANRNGRENIWSNLRPATLSQNRFNFIVSVKRKHDLPRGVYVNHTGKPFAAKIQVNGKQICLGTFETPESARTAYIAAAKQYYGCFAEGVC